MRSNCTHIKTVIVVINAGASCRHQVENMIQHATIGVDSSIVIRPYVPVKSSVSVRVLIVLRVLKGPTEARVLCSHLPLVGLIEGFLVAVYPEEVTYRLINGP